MERIEKEPISNIKAYYYSLIKYTDGLLDVSNDLKEKYESFDYRNISNQKCYELAIYEFNTCVHSLVYWKRDSDIYKKLNLLLDTAAAQYSKAYITVKEITNKKADIQEMNENLLKHEEYYMRKSDMFISSGTIYGNLYKIRQIAYDYYLFYKKNHLMLDWFNNVTKMVMPYIKAIFCTYYPDEFQVDMQEQFSRTYAIPYPIELVDIDMMVKHVKLKDLKRIASHYKVDSIELFNGINISLLFEDFCLSMKEYWNIRMIDQLKSFSFLLSLCKLNKEQNIKIVKAFITLLTLSKKEDVRTIISNIEALCIYVEKHFDETIKDYTDLLDLLINSDILLETTANLTKYSNLIKVLSKMADKRIYIHCCKEFDKMKDKSRNKTFFVYVNRKILVKYDKNKWSNWIRDNLENNWNKEIFQFLYEKTLIFDDKVKAYYEEKMMAYTKDNPTGVYTYPDHKTETINYLIMLVLIGCVSESELDFMKEYMCISDYLKFIFEPESFDYKRIKISDVMWCNFINNKKYRKLILKHKNEFWNKEEEKRIEQGFGSSFENRIAYKYLFD